MQSCDELSWAPSGRSFPFETLGKWSQEKVLWSIRILNPKWFILRDVSFRQTLRRERNLLERKYYLQKTRNWGGKEDVVQLSLLFGYTEVLYDLLQKAKKTVTRCGILLQWEQGGEMEIPVEKRRKARGTARKCFNPCPNLQFLSEAKQDNTHYIVCW